MSIDLTKPIIIDHEKPIDEQSSRLWFSVILDGGPAIEDDQWTQAKAEAYESLFEAAPKTKLEHGKMLGMLKDIARDSYCECDVYDCESPSHQLAALITEIEGPALLPNGSGAGPF